MVYCSYNKFFNCYYNSPIYLKYILVKNDLKYFLSIFKKCCLKYGI